MSSYSTGKQTKILQLAAKVIKDTLIGRQWLAMPVELYMQEVFDKMNFVYLCVHVQEWKEIFVKLT